LRLFCIIVYNAKEAQLKKVKYHTMTPPETNVSRYTPDKEAINKALNISVQVSNSLIISTHNLYKGLE
jgi:hypothetical protein